ncbi:helix-turn-helix domain-containing protein [Micromonospora sp. NPDC049101]|uniref:helix-turn-helix domain-containing protein n=1 Tax=Micromonospora sp. NPDC049101 TaxID=3155032 RepID=UPI0033E4A7AB
MSQAVKTALATSKDLRPNERLILVSIAAHANNEGDAWPSVATIAEYAGVSTRTVQRCLAKLVQLGRLVVRQAANIATRVYRLVTGTSTPGGDIQGPGGDNGSVGGDIPRVSPEVVKTKEKKNYRAAAREFLSGAKSKSANPQRAPYPYPVRQGAALPPAPGAEKCQRPGHIGQLARSCGVCRSESLAAA